MWLLPLPIVWWAALLTAGCWNDGMNLIDLLGKLPAAMNAPFSIHWTEYSARCLLYSVEFAEIEACQAAGEWDRAGEILAGAAAKLAGAGADFLLICTNTMHKVAGQVAAAIPIPLVHIAQVTADALEARGITTVGLLGTRYTMEQAFYREKLEERGIRVLVPQAPGRELVNRVIFQELCLGQVRAESRQAFLREMDALAALVKEVLC